MKIIDCAQYSDQWRKVREKKLTASNAQAIGNCGAGLKTYATEIMCEYYSKAEKNSFSNHHTDRGTELEDSAGTVYSFEKNISVRKVGFVEYNTFVGCSPDLFADENGLVEIKCKGDKAHFNVLLTGKLDSKDVWQAQCQMLICEKDWNDLVYYNPNFEDYLIVNRLFQDLEKFEKLKKGFAFGEKMLKAIIQKREGAK